MVGSGASRRSGRCERDLRACTSVTRVARETCALGEALQTSRKVSRTGCSAQRRRRDGAVGRSSVARKQGGGQRCSFRERRVAADGGQQRAKREMRKGRWDEANGAGNAGMRAQIWQTAAGGGAAGGGGGGGRVIEVPTTVWRRRQERVDALSARSSGGSRCSGVQVQVWNAQKNSREGGVRASRGSTGAPRGIIVATAMVMMDGEVRAVQVQVQVQVGRAGQPGGCWAAGLSVQSNQFA